MTFDPGLPPPEDARDADQLRVLVVLHYVRAGLAVASACFCGAYGMFFAFFLPKMMDQMVKSAPPGAQPPPRELFEMMGWMYGAMAVVGFCAEIAYAILAFMTARRIKQRRSRTFCMVASGFQCLAMPLGTALGIFTLVVLQRESVVRRFDGPSS